MSKKQIRTLLRPIVGDSLGAAVVHGSEERYRSLVESAGFGIATTDFRGKFTFVNKALCGMIGYSEKELIGRHFADFLHPEDKQRILRIFLNAWRNPTLTPSLEFRVVHRKGHIVHMFSTPTLYRHNGRILGFNAIIADITRLKQMEATVESLAKFPDEAPFPVLRLNKGGDIAYLNVAAQALLKTSGGLISKALRDASSKAIKNQLIINIEVENRDKIYSLHVTPVINANYVNVYAMDVTGTRQAEMAIRENQRKFERLFMFNPEAAVFASVNDCVLEINPRFTELFGYAPDEARGKPLDDLIVPDGLKEEAKRLAEAEEGVYHETVRKRKDGRLIPVSISGASIVCDKKHLGDMILYKDISERKRTEAALLESKQKFERLFRNMPDAAVYWDQDFRVLDANPRFTELFCYTLEEIKGKRNVDLIVPKEKLTEASILGARAKDGYVEFDTVRKKKNGTLVNVSISTAPVIVNDIVTGYTGLYKDITERKKIEDSLKESEENYRSLFENARDIIATLDTRGVVTSVNARISEYGFTKDDIVGKNMLRFVAKKHWPRVLVAMAKIVRGVPVEGELEMRTPAGRIIVEYRSNPIEHHGEVVGLQTILRDVTERKKAEEALTKSEERYRSYIEVTGELGWTTNAKGELLEDTPSWRSFTGQTYEELKGWGWTKALHPDDVEHTARIWKEAVKTASSYEAEYRVRRHDGVYRHFLARGVPVINEDGRIREWVGTCIDITERKKTEDALKSEEKRFRDVVTSTGDCVWEVDTTGKYVYISPVVEQVLGYKPEEVVGRHFFDFSSPEESEKIRKAVFKVISQKQPIKHFVSRNAHKSGRVVIFETSGVPILSNDGKLLGYRGVNHDVTERKQMEEQLRDYSEHLEELVQRRSAELLESEKRFSVLVEEANEGVMITQDLKLVFMNKKGAEILGHPKDELIGHSMEQILGKSVRRKDWMQLSTKYEQASGGNKPSITFEIEHKKGSGEVVLIEVSSTLVNYQGRPGFFSIFRDIKERKRMEEERLKLEKMATVGELSTMVAHDLRNPLTSIRNASYYMKSISEHSTDEGHQTLLEMADLIEQEIIYANNIINDLLEFAAKRPLQKEKHDINTLLDKFLKQNKLPENVKVERSFSAKTAVAVDNKQLERVFSNLTENAIQAMPTGGKLTIKTSESECGVEITFADTGAGIPSKNLGMLFQPLFTTKAKGIGMGLAICKRIIEQHDGIITVRSRVGRGTAFTIKLPK